MGKKWISFVTCFSATSDKSQQKQKKQRLGKQKSKNSSALIPEETLSLNPSSTSPPPPPPAPAAAPQPLPQPPSIIPSPSAHSPVADPQPPLPPLPSAADSGKSKDDQTRPALAPAVEEVTAEVKIQTKKSQEESAAIKIQTGKSQEETAAIKIQTAYRGYRARRRARGMIRLKELLQGQYVRRQATGMLRSMQTLTRLQAQIQERRSRLSHENKARHKLLQQRQHGATTTTSSHILAGEFDVSNKSKEQVEARHQFRKEASVRRERALAYAYSHQIWRNSSKLPHQVLMDPNNPHWGWSWLERWMASRPWDAQTDGPCDSDDLTIIVKSPFNAQKTTSQGAIWSPAGNDSKNLRAERGSHRQSLRIGGSSSTIKDEESIGSSSSPRGSLDPKKVAAKPRSTVPTTSNLGSQKKTKKKNKSVGDNKRRDASLKKSPSTTTTIPRTLSDSDEAMDVPNEESKRNRGDN